MAFPAGIVPPQDMPLAGLGGVYERIRLWSMRVFALSNLDGDECGGNTGTDDLTTDFTNVHAVRLLKTLRQPIP